MKTSQQWWEETKSDPAKLEHWLKQQYSGELSAVDRITDLIKSKGESVIIDRIIEDEKKHAEWVAQLITNRGMQIPAEDHSSNRYWDETLNSVTSMSFEQLCGIAAHAEEMRLERISVIANDPLAPADIKMTFVNILKDERMHAAGFKRLAGEAYNEAAQNHARGLEALGLII